MRLRTLFRLFLLLAAVAPITTAKADSLIIGTDTLSPDWTYIGWTTLRWTSWPATTGYSKKKFQALIHQPTA